MYPDIGISKHKKNTSNMKDYKVPPRKSATSLYLEVLLKLIVLWLTDVVHRPQRRNLSDVDTTLKHVEARIFYWENYHITWKYRDFQVN